MLFDSVFEIIRRVKQEIIYHHEIAPAREQTRLLRNLLKEKIKTSGPISFYDFMENALYDPKDGFYSERVLFQKKENLEADYLTHPISFSPQFGQGIAKLVFDLHMVNKKKGGIRTIISLAAGDGRYDKDFLDWIKENNPKFYTNIKYVLVDISKRQVCSQRHNLKNHKKKVMFVQKSGLAYLQSQKGKLKNTFVFANEWLDALPVYRIIKRNGIWKELRVTVNKSGEFIEAYGEVENEQEVKKYLSLADQIGRPFDKAIYNNHPIIINSEMIKIAEALSSALVSGFSLLIDYGMVEREPTQMVKVFSRNKKLQKSHILAYPGSVDMTTQVDWGIWLKATKLHLCSITIDLVLLKCLGVLNGNDIEASLIDQYKYPAILQSSGEYTVAGEIKTILDSAEKESIQWFHEGWFGRITKSPFPHDSWKTLLFCITERLMKMMLYTEQRKDIQLRK